MFNKEFLKLLKIELQMLKPIQYKNIEKEIGSLYLEYIKLYVQIYNITPSSNQKWSSINNCYFYALNIKTPKIFNYYSKKLTDDYFSLDVGSISGKAFLEYNNKSSETLINCLLKDLDKLNISYYDSTINSSLKHNGYKIIILYNSQTNYYHFIRQNNDNLWSCKFGLLDTIFTSDNPLLFTNDEFNNIKYDYVKTLEIVKPH